MIKPLEVTALRVAETYLGVREYPGGATNPMILAMLRLDGGRSIEGDETPWCSAFVNWIHHFLRLPRSKSLAARSWLSVGEPVALADAEPGFDVVILKRGMGPQPGPGVRYGTGTPEDPYRWPPGHVGYYVGASPSGLVQLLGGNQADSVSIADYDPARVIGVRRIR